MISLLTEPTTLGPFAVPQGALALFISLGVTSLLLRARLRGKPLLRGKVTIGLERGALVALLLWKLGPLFTMPGRVVAEPLTLLLVPGGPAVTVVALVVGAAVTAVTILRQNHARRFLAVATGSYLLVLLVLSALVANFFAAGEEHRTALPDLELELLAGESVRLRELEHPVVLNVWATWCTPCKAELPVKLEAVERYGEQFTLLDVNLTATESGVEAVRRYVDENGVTYPTVLDRSGSLSSLLGVRGTPTTVVVGQDGRVLRRRFGPMSLGWLRAGIAEAGAEE